MKLIWIAFVAVVLNVSSIAAQITEQEVRILAQKAPEGQLVVESSRMLQDNYYYFSEIMVDKLLTLKPESSNYNYRKGFIVLGSRQDYIQALPYLEKAVKDVSKNYDMYSANETSAPTDAYYHLARCYHLNEEIDKAVEFYNKFILESRKKSELLTKSELGIKQCAIAKDAIAKPKSAVVKNIGSAVNTANPEYSPVISLDGRSLYFTTRREWEDHSSDEFKDPMFNNFPEDIYVSVNDGSGGWSAPKKMEFCSPEINEATIAVSSDERRIYAYQDITGMGDLYYSDFNQNTFSTLEQVDYDGVNTDYWETHCTVTPDGNNMYFTSDRPGGFGGRDIYRVVKLPNGTWSEPINLGPTVNTAFDEESPFISVDNKTMYFASNGPNSMGGFDIFVSIRDDNNSWSEPINLGYPINRTGDDLFYTTTVDGLRGYLSSFRPNGFGEKDIYEIQNDYLGIKNAVVLKGAIRRIDDVPNSPDSYAIINCISCKDESENHKVSTRVRDGAFITTLQTCREYEIIFMENETTEIKREKLSTECVGGYQEYYKEAVLGNYYLVGLVTDKATGRPVAGAKVELMDPTSKAVLETLMTDANGKYTSNLLTGKKYGEEFQVALKINAIAYLLKSEKFNTTLGETSIVEITSLLDKVDIGTDVGKVLSLAPIYFDLNKSNIRPDAKIELDKIVTLMNENPALEIELGSHTDCRSSKAYNLKLSNARAKSSAQYIKERISNPNRISGKGYGESQLVNDCGCEGKVVSDCSEEEHAKNRRTEFKVVKL